MKETRYAFGLLLAAGLLSAGVCGASEHAATVTFAVDLNAPPAAKPFRDCTLGAVDESRIVLERGGRGLAFAEGDDHKLNYFTHPFAQIDGRPLDDCRPKSFRFAIHFPEG